MTQSTFKTSIGTFKYNTPSGEEDTEPICYIEDSEDEQKHQKTTPTKKKITTVGSKEPKTLYDPPCVLARLRTFHPHQHVL